MDFWELLIFTLGSYVGITRILAYWYNLFFVPEAPFMIAMMLMVLYHVRQESKEQKHEFSSS